MDSLRLDDSLCCSAYVYFVASLGTVRESHTGPFYTEQTRSLHWLSTPAFVDIAATLYRPLDLLRWTRG